MFIISNLYYFIMDSSAILSCSIREYFTNLVADGPGKDTLILGHTVCSGILIFERNLTLKAPITTAADDIYKYFFIVFQRK